MRDIVFIVFLDIFPISIGIIGFFDFATVDVSGNIGQSLQNRHRVGRAKCRTVNKIRENDMKRKGRGVLHRKTEANAAPTPQALSHHMLILRSCDFMPDVH